MKKAITIILMSMLALSTFTACNSNSGDNTVENSAVELQQEFDIVGVWEDQNDEYGTLTLNNDDSWKIEYTDTDNVKNEATGTYIKDGDNLTLITTHAKAYNPSNNELLHEEDFDPNDEASKDSGTLNSDNSLSFKNSEGKVIIFTKVQ